MSKLSINIEQRLKDVSQELRETEQKILYLRAERNALIEDLWGWRTVPEIAKLIHLTPNAVYAIMRENEKRRT